MGFCQHSGFIPQFACFAQSFRILPVETPLDLTNATGFTRHPILFQVGDSPLSRAASLGYTTTVELLSGHGADVEVINCCCFS